MIKILIVDDEDMVRIGLKMRLDIEEGFEIIGEAENGLEAVKKSDDLNPDIIIMDVQMDIMDGIEATKFICEKSQSVSVILHSIHADSHTKEKAFDAGAVAYIEKTGAASELIDAIHRVITK